MKKKIIIIIRLLILCLIVSSCQKQQSYHITGNLQGIPDSTVIDLYVSYENVGSRIASDTIMNGRFSFSDSIGDEILFMNIRLRDMHNFYGNCNVWAGNSDIKITGNSRYPSQWKVTSNIREQKEENKLQDQDRNLRIKNDSLRLLRSNFRDNLAREEISTKIDSINKLKNKKELSYLKTNYNSLIAVMALNTLVQFGDSAQKEIIRGIYLKMDTIYSNTLWGEGIKNFLNKAIPPAIGDHYINFYASDLQGKLHQLSDYTGKYILLDFGMMACYGCMVSAPATRELTEKYKNELFVIGINLDTRKEYWEMATKRDTITWINLSDGKGTFGGAFSIYGIDAFPTYIFIDPKGIILDRWTGSLNDIYFEKLSKYIETGKINI